MPINSSIVYLTIFKNKCFQISAQKDSIKLLNVLEFWYEHDNMIKIRIFIAISI
jgi:hypothetical protein